MWRKMRLRARYLQTVPVGGGAECAPTPETVPIAVWARFVRLMAAWFILLPISVLLVYALLVHLYREGGAVGQRDFWVSVPVWYTLLGAGAFISLII